MGEYKFLIIHCAATYPEFVLSKEVLDEWHKGPRDNQGGTVTYLGKTYQDRFSLPHDKLNGKPILNMHGRGWDRYGYRDIIHRDGAIENITPFTDDNWITNSEMTWGATGINKYSVHICLEGGLLHGRTVPFNKAEIVLYTLDQLEALENYILVETARHPQIKVAGHYQFTKEKKCPNFNVPLYLKSINRAQFAYKP